VCMCVVERVLRERGRERESSRERVQEFKSSRERERVQEFKSSREFKRVQERERERERERGGRIDNREGDRGKGSEISEKD
jgi:hypothetical protein